MILALSRCTSLLLGQRCSPQVRLNDLEVWEELLGLLVLDTGVDDHIITWNPVDGSGHFVLVARLQRIHNSQHLSCIAPSRGRV